jgi:hypothetical protein
LENEIEQLRQEIEDLKEIEKAQSETICEVAEALGLTVWGDDELGPAVKKLREECQGWVDCLVAIRETLLDIGCMHNYHRETPPMMYPEWIRYVIEKKGEK